MSANNDSVQSAEHLVPVHDDWTFEQNKAFEVALAKHFHDVDRWDKIALLVPSKSPSDVQKRFYQLEDDVRKVEDGKIQLPPYADCNQEGPQPAAKSKTDVSGMDRRKGVPWTEEEHRLFLVGLSKYGKGDWRNIARHYVISRTPTQVASHAQKYFIRLNCLSKKDKKRASIHDITSASVSEMARAQVATAFAQPLLARAGTGHLSLKGPTTLSPMVPPLAAATKVLKVNGS